MSILRTSLDSISDILPDQISVFFACASFEERCLSVLRALGSSRIEQGYIVIHEDFRGPVARNATAMMAFLQGKGVSLAADTRDPLVGADSFREALEQARTADKSLVYLVDVTTFTHESLLILFRLLLSFRRAQDRVLLVYNGAEEYALRLPDEEKWLSKGIREVRTVLGYIGEMEPGRKTHLIILVGYEHERAAKLIEVFEPTVISLGYGRPGTGTAASHEGANEHFLRLVSRNASFHGEPNIFQFSCVDPLDAKRAILEVVTEIGDMNHVVAPMNTKFSTIGAGLASIEKRGIQVCYAQANIYNFEGYSRPGRTCYVFEVPRGETGDLGG